MSIHRLQPDAAAVVNVPGLVDMIHAIEAYVTPRNGNNSSQHAADVYLAMALGFEQAGVAMVSDFPSLRVSDGSNRVEITLKNVHRYEDRHNATPLSKPGDDKCPIASFLTTLEAAFPSSSSNSLTIDPVAYDLSFVGTDYSSHILHQYRYLQQLHQTEDTISIQLNFAYTQLGQSFEAYVNTLDVKSLSTKTRTRVAFEKLIRELNCAELMVTKAEREKMRKRIERGRKFGHIVQALGTEVLYLYPQVCVTRVDRFSLGQLADLLGVYGFRVNCLRAKLEDPFIARMQLETPAELQEPA